MVDLTADAPRFIQVEEVLTMDASSGRIHRRARTAEGKLLSYEGCNLDDAGAYKILTRAEALAALEVAEPGQLCENDFPEGPSAERLARYAG